MDLIKAKAKELERKAYRNEKVLRNTKERKVEDDMAVNDLYIDAITAKLKMLDRI